MKAQNSSRRFRGYRDLSDVVGALDPLASPDTMVADVASQNPGTRHSPSCRSERAIPRRTLGCEGADMASNDQEILTNVLTQRRDQVAPGATDQDYFEIFCSEQILKN